MPDDIHDNYHEAGEHKAPLGSRVLAAAIIISLIFGAFGGVLGALYFAKLPSVQKIFGSNSAGTQFSVQQGVYKEDSAVIDVVKKDSPAVVSIIISKDISQLPNFNNGFGQFFGFSFPGQAQPPQNATPNIQQVGAGSGFFVSSDGLILTNKHVVSDPQASYTVTTTDGKTYPAKVMAQDPVNDLAILKVDVQNAPTLSLVDSNQIQIGQQVVAIGNSLGQYQNTVTTGVVSGIGRSIRAGDSGGGTQTEQLEGVIQTDAAINPGNSGGPLLNLAGQVIGINTAIDQQGQLVGFALPANDAAKALASYQKDGRIVRPFLGVRYLMIDQALADQLKLGRDYGALVSAGPNSNQPAVLPGSPAEKAGLQNNDIILAINGHRVDQNNTLAKELKNYNVGDTLALTIYRSGGEKTLNITVGEAK